MFDKKAARILKAMAVIFCVVLVYLFMDKFPMQKLNITAQTETEEFNLSDSMHLYCTDKLKAGKEYTAVIKFMAVPDTSRNLFTRFGKGQYVNLGCSELKAECGFVSLGRFMDIRLKLKVAQTDLQLEDGTPFDITRYSLKPVLTIEER